MKPWMWCDREMVQCPFHYGLATSEKDYHNELRRLNVPEKDWAPFLSDTRADAAVHWIEHVKTGRLVAIVCIRVNDRHTGLEVAGLLVHEAVHLWQEVRENIGERAPSAEFEAYSIQTIAQELMWQYREQVVRRRRR